MTPWLLALGLVTASQATEPSALDRTWYLAETSRIEEALAATAQLLQDDPSDVGAHRLYAWLHTKALRDAPGAEALYREWLVQQPGNDAARIVLANQLRWQNRHPGEWCAEAEDLLAQPPTALQDVYWAQRALYEIRQVCPGDQHAPRLAVEKLGEQLPEARAYGLRLQLEDQQIDRELAAELEAFMLEQPWRLTYAGNLWKMRGEGVDQARDAALAQAQRGLDSGDPLLVESARRVYRYADEQEKLLEAEERLIQLDPAYERNQFQFEGNVQWVSRPDPEAYETLFAFRAAIRGQRPKRAIAMARDFEDRLEASGPERAQFYTRMVELYAAAGKPMLALEATRQAWLAQPDDPYLANDFAYRAATAGLHLEQALEASEAAVQAMAAYDPRGAHPAQSYEDWLAQSADHAAAFSDTHGWVLYRLGRHEEAAGVLRRAILLAHSPDAAHHLHLGLAYDALDDAQGALLHLGRGMALADGDDRDLERQAYKRLVALYQAHRWAPGGVEAWIALQAPDGGSAEHGQAAEAEAGSASRLRIGEVLADLGFEQDGVQRSLSELEGVRVVDLWATWCGPCVEALPSMDKLARRYADEGVTFLAISVDAGPEDVTAHFDGDEPEHLVLGWAGRRAMREAKITGIPASFVLDAEGTIRAFHRGWDLGPGGDKRSSERLAASIDELLEEQAEKDKE
jgi:thiol-disulfide isomerase/thioredoxin